MLDKAASKEAIHILLEKEKKIVQEIKFLIGFPFFPLKYFFFLQETNEGKKQIIYGIGKNFMKDCVTWEEAHTRVGKEHKEGTVAVVKCY